MAFVFLIVNSIRLNGLTFLSWFNKIMVSMILNREREEKQIWKMLFALNVVLRMNMR